MILKGWWKKLEAVAEVNEKVVEASEVEMENLEQRIEAFDTSYSVEIDQHVSELEMVLLAIANETD